MSGLKTRLAALQRRTRGAQPESAERRAIREFIAVQDTATLRTIIADRGWQPPAGPIT